MRLLSELLVALLIAVPAFAQDFGDVSKYMPGFPGCKTCGMKSAIDWIQNVEVDGVKRPVIAGWGFECFSGKPTDRVETSAWDPSQGIFVPVATELRWPNISRMDVFLAKVAECPNASGASGFGAVIVGTLPENTTMLRITVWRGPFVQNTQIPVLTR